MNKYFNKGLLYQWFNASKVSIFMGIIAWVIFFDRIILSDILNAVKENIANNQSDYFMSIAIDKYLLLCIIFLMIYYISTGNNKGNTMAFLSSGPFTKKQIKYNELIGLIITVFLFVVATLYISIIFYIRNREFLAIVNGYNKIILLECLKILFIGILGILFMLIVNMLFSNTVAASIALIFIIPESLIFSFEKMVDILSYIDIGKGENIFDKLNFSGIIPQSNYVVYIDCIQSLQLTSKKLFIESVIVAVLIVIGTIIFDICQNRYKLENWNKIFSSKLSEKIVLMIASMGISSILSFLFLSECIDNMAWNEGRFIPLSGLKMVKVVGFKVFGMAIFVSIIYYILKKLLNKMI